MKTTLSSFTRGSQLLGHFGHMFAAGLRFPLWMTVIVVGSWVAWRLYDQLTIHEHYLVLMRLQGLAYRWFEFNPAKAVAIETVDGLRVMMSWGTLLEWQPMTAAWTRMMSVARGAAASAGIAMGPLLALYFWYSRRFGNRAKERRHERGAALVGLPELCDEIEAKNEPRRAEKMREIFGRAWHLKARLTSEAELDAAGVYRPFRLAGVSYPWLLEQSHAMLIGTTGTGKTVLLRDLLAQVRARGMSAVVFDLTGAFIEAFYDPARDVILNPLDERCPYWSIFGECETESEFTAVAEALIPHDGGTSEPFWVHAARMLFVETCMRLKKLGRGTNQALATELMTADLKHVHNLVQGTVADPITAPEAARMAESVRAVFNTNAKALLSLPPLPEDGEIFSVKRWTWGQRAPGSILFLSARYVDMSLSRVLLTMWMDQAINTLMTTERSQEPKLWFMLDEVGALHRLPALEKGLQTARQYGGAIILGVHSFSKLKDTYGENMANTLASLARTKLILATADRITATWGSDFIGHAQFKDVDESYSYGYNNVRDAVSMTPRRVVEPLVLPDQIMNLPALVGYLKFPDGLPAASLKIPVRSYPPVAHGFMKRRVAGVPEALAPVTDENAAEEAAAPVKGVVAPLGPAATAKAKRPTVDVNPASNRARTSDEGEESQSDTTADGGPGIAIGNGGAAIRKPGAEQRATQLSERDTTAPDDARDPMPKKVIDADLARKLARPNDADSAANDPSPEPSPSGQNREVTVRQEPGRVPVEANGAQRDPSWARPLTSQGQGPEEQGRRELREGVALLDDGRGLGD